MKNPNAMEAKPARLGCNVALAAIGREQLAVLSNALAELLEGEEPEAIHDLRVSTRRLQALLSALEAFPGGEALRQLRRSLRRLRFVLGDWRNCDVSLEEIGGRRERAPEPSEREAWLRIEQDLRVRREDAIRRGRSRIRRAIEKNLVGRIAAAIDERLAMLRSTALRQAVDTRIAKAWAQWNECLQAAEETPSVELLHALRVATKRMRYSVELARDLSRTRAKPVLDWARAAQKALGDWHDQEMLHRAIAEAVARPDLALDEPDATLAVLTILANERRAVPRPGRSLVALARPDEAKATMRRWRRPAVTLHDGVNGSTEARQQRSGSLPGEGGEAKVSSARATRSRPS